MAYLWMKCQSLWHFWFSVLSTFLFNFYLALLGFWQISLLEMPEHRRKKMMALTTNIMRDDSDKVMIDVSFDLLLDI